MKKVTSILLALVLVLGLVGSAFAANVVTDADPADLDPSYTANITPTVTIESAGYVNLAITYTNPAIKLGVGTDGKLKDGAAADMKGSFTMENNSIASVGGSFTGALSVAVTAVTATPATIAVSTPATAYSLATDGTDDAELTYTLGAGGKVEYAAGVAATIQTAAATTVTFAITAE